MALYYEMRQMLLQNVTAILLQNAAKGYYKMRRLLKLRQYIQKQGILLSIF